MTMFVDFTSHALKCQTCDAICKASDDTKEGAARKARAAGWRVDPSTCPSCLKDELVVEEAQRAAGRRASEAPTKAMRAFLREALKPNGGRAIYGADAVGRALEENRVAIVLAAGKPRKGAGVVYHAYDTKTEAGRILEEAFGGVGAILKGAR